MIEVKTLKVDMVATLSDGRKAEIGFITSSFTNNDEMRIEAEKMLKACLIILDEEVAHENERDRSDEVIAELVTRVAVENNK